MIHEEFHPVLISDYITKHCGEIIIAGTKYKDPRETLVIKRADKFKSIINILDDFGVSSQTFKTQLLRLSEEQREKIITVPLQNFIDVIEKRLLSKTILVHYRKELSKAYINKIEI